MRNSWGIGLTRGLLAGRTSGAGTMLTLELNCRHGQPSARLDNLVLAHRTAIACLETGKYDRRHHGEQPEHNEGQMDAMHHFGRISLEAIWNKKGRGQACC